MNPIMFGVMPYDYVCGYNLLLRRPSNRQRSGFKAFPALFATGIGFIARDLTNALVAKACM